MMFDESKNFNPRPPWGGRQKPVCSVYRERTISIHALRGEGDIIIGIKSVVLTISIHALRGEGDLEKRNAAAS